MNHIIETLKEENLCTYFILPLIGLNKEKFGGSNFLNCYVSKNPNFCYVKVLEPLLGYIPPTIDTIIRSNGTFYKLQIPEEWIPDVRIFLEGKYSKMSYSAKQRIYNHSGLIYKRLVGDTPNDVVTDIRLLALKKDPKVKDFWESALYDRKEESVIEETDEVLSKPSEKDFIENQLGVHSH